MAPKKILIVLTNVDYMESAKRPTGWYLPEFSHPYDLLVKAGFEIVTASPKGGLAPLDDYSVQAYKDDPSSSSFFANQKALWEKTQVLSKFRGHADEFAAVYYPGGHGPMFDLVDDPDSIAIIEEFAAKDKVVAAVCHASSVLINAKGKNGKLILDGKDATGFSDAEEDAFQLTQFMPWSVEGRMKAAGANYKKAPELWGPLVLVQDGGKLITGQNPNSAKGVGEAIVKAIGA